MGFCPNRGEMVRHLSGGVHQASTKAGEMLVFGELKEE